MMKGQKKMPDVFSSVRCLTADALEAVTSEQLENAFHHERVELSEWEALESDHVTNLVLESPGACREINVSVEAIQKAYEMGAGESPVFCSVASVFIAGIRAGWHSRGALLDAPYLANWCGIEPEPDEVRAWMESICEL
jgi:hypothetical protein